MYLYEMMLFTSLLQLTAYAGARDMESDSTHGALACSNFGISHNAELKFGHVYTSKRQRFHRCMQ